MLCMMYFAELYANIFFFIEFQDLQLFLTFWIWLWTTVLMWIKFLVWTDCIIRIILYFPTYYKEKKRILFRRFFVLQHLHWRIQHYCKMHGGEHKQKINNKLRHNVLLMISSVDLLVSLKPLPYTDYTFLIF